MLHAIGLIVVVCAIYWAFNQRPADGGPSLIEKCVGILLLLIPVAVVGSVLFFILACVSAYRQSKGG